MNRTSIARNAEAYVQAFKDILELDTVDDLPKAAKQAQTAMERIQADARDDTRVRAAMETLEEQARTFATALKASDKQQAAKALILIEEAVQHMREEHTGAEKVEMPDAGAAPDA